MMFFAKFLVMGALHLAGLVVPRFRTVSPPSVARQNAVSNLQKELDCLLATASPIDRPKFKQEFESFMKIFNKYNSGGTAQIDWDKIEPLPTSWMRDYGSLNAPTDEVVREQLSKLVVVKLNGGLGTTMGCRGPKATIHVRDHLTFLDLTVQQIEYLNKKYSVSVPLVLMNSFYTDKDTQEIILQYEGRQVEIETFQQSAFPRLNRETLLPLAADVDIHRTPEAWYPPGHGDFYESFRNSGLLKKFKDQGKEFVFLSNIDNLGAIVDGKILNMLLSSLPDQRPEIVVELTAKSPADVKGGTLIDYQSKLRLLEFAQVPEQHREEFKSTKRFSVFNTNNVWIDLNAIEREVAHGSLSMTVIANPKTVGTTPVLQLEVAVADAVTCFNRGIGVKVPRSRMVPVKTTSDLLIAMSNLFVLDQGHFKVNPQRSLPGLPTITLDERYYSKVDDFMARFKSVPDLLELEELNVYGDVSFGENVVLKGKVSITASGKQMLIASQTVLNNRHLFSQQL